MPNTVIFFLNFPAPTEARWMETVYQLGTDGCQSREFVYNFKCKYHCDASHNYLDKYADDTYLIVPASNSCTIPAELDNVSAWATANNLLSLNVIIKSCEMIVRRPRMAVNDPAIPPAHPGLKRVSELNILGVQISDRLEFTPHVNHITV